MRAARATRAEWLEWSGTSPGASLVLLGETSQSCFRGSGGGLCFVSFHACKEKCKLMFTFTPSSVFNSLSQGNILLSPQCHLATCVWCESCDLSPLLTHFPAAVGSQCSRTRSGARAVPCPAVSVSLPVTSLCLELLRPPTQLQHFVLDLTTLLVDAALLSLLTRSLWHSFSSLAPFYDIWLSAGLDT